MCYVVFICPLVVRLMLFTNYLHFTHFNISIFNFAKSHFLQKFPIFNGYNSVWKWEQCYKEQLNFPVSYQNTF